MQSCTSLALATLACSALALGQAPFLYPAVNPIATDAYQIGYAANLNVGDSVLNLSNVGVNGGTTAGNICVNVFTFDAAEEQIACCACLVTPDGLNSLSVKNDLVSNSLTPVVPTSAIIKLVSSFPSTDAAGNPTVCNPAGIYTLNLGGPPSVNLAAGMRAWGTTMEPDGSAATYGAVSVHYQASPLSPSEILQLTRNCGFIQQQGSGYGACKSCRLGGLAGAKE
jgi:hypothetical protein